MSGQLPKLYNVNPSNNSSSSSAVHPGVKSGNAIPDKT